jgi:hypothetical protein
MIIKIAIIAFFLTFSNILYSQGIEQSFYIPQKGAFPDSILFRLKILEEDKFVSDDFTFKDINIKVSNYLPSTSCKLMKSRIADMDTCLKYFDTCSCIYFDQYLILALKRGFHRYLNNKEYDLYEEIEKYLPECHKLRADLLKNWTADSIRGIYIPNNVEEAVEKLLEILPDDRLNEFKEIDESEIVGIEHLNLGSFIRNYWNLWGNSRLNNYFHENYSVYHPESISSCLILFLHRKLNNKDLGIDSTMKYYMELDAEYIIEE